MRKLVGDKQAFAIEFDLERLRPQPFGKLCFWLGGISIGAFDDSHLINASLHQIRNILNRPVDNSDYAKLSAERVFELIKEKGLGEYFLNIGEAFDDFSIIVYEHGSKYHFVWQLHEKPFFEYPDHPVGIQSCRVPEKVIEQVIDETQSILDSSELH